MFPFYNELVAMSGCDEDGATRTYELIELCDKLMSETPEERWHQPAGFMIHAMRVGSTAAANMVGAHSDAIVFKEPTALTDILLWFSGNLRSQHRPSRRQARQALRAVVHIFFPRSGLAALQRALTKHLHGGRRCAGRAGKAGIQAFERRNRHRCSVEFAA